MTKSKPTLNREKFIEEQKQRKYERQVKILEKINIAYQQPKPEYKHDATKYKPESLIKAEKKFNYTEVQNIEEVNNTIQAHFDKVKTIENDTTYTLHGMLTHDKRYKGETGEIADLIRNTHHLSNDQAYYFYYFAVTNKLSYEEVKEQLLSSRDFEDYDKLKRMRRSEL